MVDIGASTVLLSTLVVSGPSDPRRITYPWKTASERILVLTKGSVIKRSKSAFRGEDRIDSSLNQTLPKK